MKMPEKYTKEEVRAINALIPEAQVRSEMDCRELARKTSNAIGRIKAGPYYSKRFHWHMNELAAAAGLRPNLNERRKQQ